MAKKKEASETGDERRFESKYNALQLRESIMGGDSAVQIMEKLGIKHKQTLKQYILKLMSDDRTFYEVKGLYMKNTRRPKVNKQGVVKLHLKDLDLGDMVFTEDDEFIVSMDGCKIVLEKIGS